MAHAERAGLLTWLIEMAGSAMAMTPLQPAANQCFANPSAAGCDGVWEEPKKHMPLSSIPQLAPLLSLSDWRLARLSSNSGLA